MKSKVVRRCSRSGCPLGELRGQHLFTIGADSLHAPSYFSADRMLLVDPVSSSLPFRSLCLALASYDRIRQTYSGTGEADI